MYFYGKKTTYFIVHHFYTVTFLTIEKDMKFAQNAVLYINRYKPVLLDHLLDCLFAVNVLVMSRIEFSFPNCCHCECNVY